MSKSLLKVENLKTHFPIRKGLLSKIKSYVHAVDGVSLEVKEGETLGLVGESGCGKSTLGRTIIKLYDPTDGRVEFEGQDLAHLNDKEIKPLRRDMQMIFQDPFSSLDPRMSVERIVTEPFRLHGELTREERIERAAELLELVGLKRADLKKYPHEFSGGQRQRIGIARALALNPKLVIADEPIAALDVSIQAQVLNLMSELKKKFNLTYVFISHDLAVVKYFSDRVAVMYLGKIVELTTSDKIYTEALHPYTRALMSAILHPDPSKKVQHQVLEGDVPSPIYRPSGCHFHPRCPYATDLCKTQEPSLREFSQDDVSHTVSCHRVEELMKEWNIDKA